MLRRANSLQPPSPGCKAATRLCSGLGFGEPRSTWAGRKPQTPDFMVCSFLRTHEEDEAVQHPGSGGGVSSPYLNLFLRTP